MKVIDGGTKSGSGTIVRYSVALASLLSKEIKIQNIRQRRDKPGLRAQHLKVIGSTSISVKIMTLLLWS